MPRNGSKRNFNKTETMIFNEQKLREEIKSVWGEHGAHMTVFDSMIKKIESPPRIIMLFDYELSNFNKLLIFIAAHDWSQKIVLKMIRRKVKRKYIRYERAREILESKNV